MNFKRHITKEDFKDDLFEKPFELRIGEWIDFDNDGGCFKKYQIFHKKSHTVFPMRYNKIKKSYYHFNNSIIKKFLDTENIPYKLFDYGNFYSIEIRESLVEKSVE